MSCVLSLEYRGVGAICAVLLANDCDKRLVWHDVVTMDRSAALTLDLIDPLAHLRDRFVVPDGIYLDGNSLGVLPVGVAEAVAAVVHEQWGTDLIRSWNLHGWIDAPRRVGERIAALVGARPTEVIAADSTSINLYKLLHAALHLNPNRRVILTEAGNFPSDLYIVESVARLAGASVRVVDGDDLAGGIDADVAVITTSHVDYRSGRRHNVASLTKAAHGAGALTVWDLAHSAGALQVELNDWHADFAVGCGYKFLNGGPGAPAFAFVAERHHATFTQPLTGWLGHAAPFAMSTEYQPAPGLGRAIVGTPPMLSMAALEAALRAFEGVSMADLEAKGAALTALLIDLAKAWCPSVTVVTPPEASHRGSHVALRHPNGYEIVQALIARGVVGDFREPDIIRLGVAPLYNTFVEMYDAMAALREVLDQQSWADPVYAVRNAVT